MAMQLDGLDEGGLAVALAQAVAPFAPVVTLDVPAELAELALPAATEVAAYRIVAEAATNAARSTGGTTTGTGAGSSPAE